MNTWNLALRNLLRNRRRSLATLCALMIGSVALLLFDGYVVNITYGLQTDYVRSGGHLQLQNPDYYLYGSGDPTAFGIPDYEQVMDTIRKDPVLAPMLTVVTPTLEFGGIAGNFDAGVSRTIVANGSVIADQNVLQLWNDYHFPGPDTTLALTGTPPDTAVIGTGVARVLRLCAGLHVANCPKPASTPQADGPRLAEDVANLASREVDQTAKQPSAGNSIELLAATTGGAPNVTRLNVAKALDTGIKQLDDVYVSLHLEQAQRLLYGRRPPQATAIEIQLQHTGQIPTAVQRLKELLATTLRSHPLSIYDFQELNPFYGQTIRLFHAIFGFIALLMGAIVLFTVGNTMNAAVVERTVEIGTLRAIGLRRSGVRKLFVTEGVLIGAMGAILGVLVAIALAAAINGSGATWTPPGRTDPIHLHVRVWGDTAMLCGTTLGLMAIAILSSWWPARRAAKLLAVEALRHV